MCAASVGVLYIETLQKVALEIERSDLPAEDEAESISRDLSRFEMATIPWARVVVRFRIRSSLQQSVGLALKQELRQYGNAPSQWGCEFMNKVYPRALTLKSPVITGHFLTS
jgi:hypothetical protein